MRTAKDFDAWNKIKKNIATQEIPISLFPFPQKREVWMCMLGRNIGIEQNGGGDNFSRPILVVKKFNNQMFWVIPLSTKQKSYDFYYNFTDPKNQRVSMILSQLRVMSVKRFDRPMYQLSSEHFQNVLKRLKEFLS